jgi:hypothetical protein
VRCITAKGKISVSGEEKNMWKIAAALLPHIEENHKNSETVNLWQRFQIATFRISRKNAKPPTMSEELTYKEIS